VSDACGADPLRTVVTSYPVRRIVQLRHSDLDPSGVVGPTAIGRLFEEARYVVRRTIDHPQARDPDAGFVLARVRIEFLAPVHYPGEAEVGIAVAGVGRTSFSYAAALFQHGRCVALSDATVAVRDRRTGTGCVLAPSFHDVMARAALGASGPAAGLTTAAGAPPAR
jgi:acyl-CoA thioester hydrolase